MRVGEEIRGEGGKHVMKFGPEILSDSTGAVVTAAGLSGGAPAPPLRRGGWTAQARPGLHGMPDYLNPPRTAHYTVTPFANGS